MRKIKRVLIANRGEIAVRVIRACKDLEIETVLAASEIDKKSLPARIADRAVCIGPSKPEDSYLKVEAIITAALGTRSDAIHPGYGFLSENPKLPEACLEQGITFIGPPKDAVVKMGDKAIARTLASQVGVPVVPGAELLESPREALKIAENLGYPVLLKAVAGGGGRGIAIIKDSRDMKPTFDIASAEARFSFGDDRLYMERFISNARHIEVQILADCFGNIVHLGERDCSLQRRHQKVLEEAPSSVVPDNIKQKMYSAAIAVSREIKYEGAGTVEFIFDMDTQEFYFLEMNTRIQVEHPLTEVITGIDLVKEQINLAAESPLNVSQPKIGMNGHAIECRINAESFNEGFRPSPGTIAEWNPPTGNEIRIDTHCYPGYTVPPYYDSLLAKVIVKDSSRESAIYRMKEALTKFSIGGIATNLDFHKLVLDNPEFIANATNTMWIENLLAEKAGV